MTYRVDPHSSAPPSRQLVEAVLDAVARGDLVSGNRLPSVRSMAAEALVNPNTVGKAYRELEHLRIVQGRNGSGVFVTEQGPDLARSLRRDATLEAYRLAAREALRSGHGSTVLQRELTSISKNNGRGKTQ